MVTVSRPKTKNQIQCRPGGETNLSAPRYHQKKKLDSQPFKTRRGTREAVDKRSLRTSFCVPQSWDHVKVGGSDESIFPGPPKLFKRPPYYTTLLYYALSILPIRRSEMS